MTLNTLVGLDESLFRYINEISGNPVLDYVMILISSNYLWLLAVVIMLAVAFKTPNSRLKVLLVLLVVGCGLTDLVSFEILKPYFARLRPCHGLTDVLKVTGGCGSQYGFPSNHGANAMAAFTVLMMVYKNLSPWQISLAVFAVLAVGISRPYLGVHYPLDIFAGYIAGFIVSWTSLKTIDQFFWKIKGRHLLI